MNWMNFLRDDTSSIRPGARARRRNGDHAGVQAAEERFDELETGCVKKQHPSASESLALEHGLAPCRGLPGVKDVRVKGAIGVVELERIDDLEGLRARFVAEGVFVRPFGSIIYLTPAFTIGAEELAKLTDTVVNLLRRGG